MPLPKPKANESRNDFMQRCMADNTMNKEFPNKAQRFAVCVTQYTDDVRK